MPQEWLIWTTKTTREFRYRINPDIAKTFKIRSQLKPAEPRRQRGRPRKVAVDAEPGAKEYCTEDEEQRGNIHGDNNNNCEEVEETDVGNLSAEMEDCDLGPVPRAG